MAPRESSVCSVEVRPRPLQLRKVFNPLIGISFLATVHEFGTPEYAALINPETRQPSSRAVILVHVWKVGTVSIPSYPTQLIRSHVD